MAGFPDPATSVMVVPVGQGHTGLRVSDNPGKGQEGNGDVIDGIARIVSFCEKKCGCYANVAFIPACVHNLSEGSHREYKDTLNALGLRAENRQ